MGLTMFVGYYPIKPPLNHHYITHHEIPILAGCIQLSHHFSHHPHIDMNFSWQLSTDGALAPSAAWITAKKISTKPATTMTSSLSGGKKQRPFLQHVCMYECMSLHVCMYVRTYLCMYVCIMSISISRCVSFAYLISYHITHITFSRMEKCRYAKRCLLDMHIHIIFIPAQPTI